MRIYDNIEETISEWSRVLRIRRCNTIQETLKLWSKRLTDKYSRPFVIRATAEETLKEWSKLI